MLCAKLEGCYKAAAILTEVRTSFGDCFLGMQGTLMVVGVEWHPFTPASSRLGFRA